MNARSDLVLRYFDARGRAQFIRYYFEARQIPFDDQRVPLSEDFSEWRAIRDDMAISGPFKKLPVLHYGDEVVAETLVISSFLHERFGDAKALSPQDNLRHAMLSSSLCSDIMYLLATLLWADRVYEGIDFPSFVKQTLERVRRHLEVLNDVLDRWRWVDGLASRRIMLADCLLWDQLRNTADIFGDHLDLRAFATLNGFFEGCPARRDFLALAESRPCQITGRHGEAAIIERIRNCVDLMGRTEDEIEPVKTGER